MLKLKLQNMPAITFLSQNTLSRWIKKAKIYSRIFGAPQLEMYTSHLDINLYRDKTLS